MPEELEPETTSVDPSHDLDMVPIFSSASVDAEMEAMAIHGILEAGGIPSLIVGTATIPVLPIQVMVPKARKEEAERAIGEAQEAGPAAAAEAEEASEGTP
ncbi:MAG TPA: hypothetical protein VG672_08420 [Bryobacteraceae bacterium]|jgi:hypothetical protein|nr:hypothetical protein [Bryobacteraceae bacterium]